MGVDWSAYAAIGVAVERDRFWDYKVVKAFKHDYPEDMKFDPQTGKKLWTTEAIEVPGFNFIKMTFNGFDVLEDDEDYIIALKYVKVSPDDVMSDMIDLNDTFLCSDIIEFKDRMKSFKFDIDTFGLHCVLNCC